MPSVALLKASEAGNAEAQYFYWMRRVDEEFKLHHHISGEMSAVVRQFGPNEVQSKQDKWTTAAETELRQAAASGDIGAKMS